MTAQPASESFRPELSLVPTPAGHAPPHPVVSAECYRSVFRHHASGVAAVTAGPAGADPVGFTATSVVSVSLNPPMVSFSLASRSSSFAIVERTRTAAINLLDAEQAELADRFATSGLDRFAAPTRWSRLSDGTPILDDAAGLLYGQITHRLAVGDHHIIVIVLRQAEIRRPYRPLVHHDGGYGEFVPASAGTGAEGPRR